MSLPKKSINLMQHVQNTAAKVILNRHTTDSATQCLTELHWVPQQQRIEQQICTIVFKALHKKAPRYLQDLINIYKVRRQGLESSVKPNILEVPATKRRILESRSFSVYGPNLWNTLPDKLRTCDNNETFKKELKT